jgi:protease I
MAGETLQGMKVAILVTDGFEQVELTEPRKALDQAGADTHVVSPKGDEVRGWNVTDWGQSLPVDLKLDTPDRRISMRFCYRAVSRTG